jgi:hypothetical protein
VAEFLDMQDQVIRQRLENAMQQWEHLAEIQIQQFHGRLDALLFHNQQLFLDMDRWVESPQSALEREEAFYGALSGIREDRMEYGYENELARLIDRVAEMQQAREQGQQRSHEQGMGL